jgi:hypothetical protein
MTLAVFSYQWKENPAYRLAEHLCTGIMAGHGVAVALGSVMEMGVTPLFQKGDLILAVPLILGLMIHTRWFPKYSWLARWPIAFYMGIAAAVSIQGALEASFARQIIATMRLSLTVPNNVLVVIGVVTTLSYFLFVGNQKGPMRYVSSVGRWVMMAAFGAGFGYTVMARMSLLIARLQLLFGDWIRLIPN